MTTAKIQITVGSISFSGEGNEAWLEKQLDKMLAAAPKLAAANEATQTPHASGGKDSTDTEKTVGPLATYLQKVNPSGNGVKKFLATAHWLHLKGAKHVSTSDVTKALSDSRQTRLGNASETLNQNVAKGHIEKTGKHFYVTTDGVATLK